MSHTEPQASSVSLRLAEDQLAQVRSHITRFIEDQVTTADANGAVIALSGGVDSSLTAYLAVEALGPDCVHGLIMPGEGTQDDSLSDAERVAKELDIPSDVVEIAPIVERLLEAYPDASNDTIAVGNARARVRAVLNYLVANHEDGLVLGTGNRTELLIGYFTKYGDGAVDCLPIGNLYKQQVRQLARYVGVPTKIIEKPATAELWAGQTDEDELGLDYDTLDAILAVHIENPNPRVLAIRNASPLNAIQALDLGEPLPAGQTADLLDVTEQDVRRISRLHTASSHKRRMPPAPEPHFREDGS